MYLTFSKLFRLHLVRGLVHSLIKRENTREPALKFGLGNNEEMIGVETLVRKQLICLFKLDLKGKGVQPFQAHFSRLSSDFE